MTEQRRNLLIVVLGAVLLIAVAALIEHGTGRPSLGPGGQFALWSNDVSTSEQSRSFADPFSLSHVTHGFLFFLLILLVARRLPVRYRFLCALLLEVGWELLENSPFLIHRYQTATVSTTYLGDSVLNSMGDVLMMVGGFLIASRLRPWVNAIIIVAIELFMLLWIRDNITIDTIMLIHPIEAIKAWQSAGM